MQSIDEARTKILAELRAEEDADVRAQFWRHFEPDITQFVEGMAAAYVALHAVDRAVRGDEGRGIVAALVYTALMLNVLSMKLMLSGHVVPAGALSRQVLEAVALALLCAKKDLGVRARFAKGKYSANDAVSHLIRKCKQLSLKPDALDIVRSAQSFYHKYSHISQLTIAAAVSFNGEGLYVGAAFDKGKLESYAKEVRTRTSLALVLPNFVGTVEQHLEKPSTP